MKHKLKEVFDQIQAEEALKDKQKNSFSRSQGVPKRKPGSRRPFLYAVACLLLLLWAGYWLYFTSTVQISIEINPSIELGVNRFDRIISVNRVPGGREGIGGFSKSPVHGIYRSRKTDIGEPNRQEAVIQGRGNGNRRHRPEGAQSSRILSNLEACAAEKKTPAVITRPQRKCRGPARRAFLMENTKLFWRYKPFPPTLRQKR